MAGRGGPDDLVHRFADNGSDHLGGKTVARDGSHGQHIPRGWIQPPEAFLDDTLDARRHVFPTKFRGDHPSARPVPGQCALLFEILEQLDSEQSVTACVPEKSLPESGAQVIRLGVQQLVDEVQAVVLRSSYLDLDVTVVTLDLVRRRLQGMPFALASGGHLLGPEGADDQDMLLHEPAGEMKQQVDGRVVRPVQIIDDHDQRLALSQLPENIRVLLTDVALVDTARGMLAPGGPMQTLPEPGRTGGLRPEASHQRAAGNEDVDEIRPVFDERPGSQAEETCRPGRVGFRGARRRGGPRGLARQLGEDLAERQVGIAHSRLRVAVAIGDYHVRVQLACAPAELRKKGGLPGPGLTGHEAD